VCGVLARSVSAVGEKTSNSPTAETTLHPPSAEAQKVLALLQLQTLCVMQLVVWKLGQATIDEPVRLF
jgi:hypothetical protein